MTATTRTAATAVAVVHTGVTETAHRPQDAASPPTTTRPQRQARRKKIPPSPRKRPAAAGSSADTTKPPKRAPAAAASGGPGMEMIIVHVNDRLGTKAAIPCLPSDTIRQFKIIVAARIGREPHEILLKRQGQRPFKDMLSLADYEISNGVQLDLEVDTGD
ncbi:ubiquitin-like protein [Apiospora arundinis]